MVKMLLASYHFAPWKTKMLKIICLSYSVALYLTKKKFYILPCCFALKSTAMPYPFTLLAVISGDLSM